MPSATAKTVITNPRRVSAFVLAALCSATACERGPLRQVGNDAAINAQTGGASGTGSGPATGTGGAPASGTGGAIPAGSGGTAQGSGGMIPPSNCGTPALPADNQVEGWWQDGSPATVNGDSALFDRIDGAAPKYIEYGWQRSIFALYKMGPISMEVAIHDMSSAENSERIFDRYLPVTRIEILAQPKAVVDTSLSAAYRSQAFAGRYYVEVTINARTDAALASIEAFTLRVLQCVGPSN